MLEIIPSILTDNIDEARDLIARCEGIVSRVHIDIIDSKFVDNVTIFPEKLESIETPLMFDYHLMVDEPINWFERSLKGQAQRVIGQIEKMKNQVDFVGEAQKLGLKVGLALDLDTPIDDIDPAILTDVDIILIMSVKAGWGGQKFHPEVLKKVKDLSEIRQKDMTPFNICVDGGETLEVIDDTVRMGADEVAIGKRLFRGDIKENLNKFLEAAL